MLARDFRLWLFFFALKVPESHETVLFSRFMTRASYKRAQEEVRGCCPRRLRACIIDRVLGWGADVLRESVCVAVRSRVFSPPSSEYSPPEQLILLE